MKKLLLILIAVVMILSLSGCGLPQKVKTQEQEALIIAQSIPIPPSYYSSQTGNQMVVQPIVVSFTGRYYKETGEPLFTISVCYIDPISLSFWHKYFGWHSDESTTYYLSYITAMAKDSEWSMSNELFTIQGLENHKTELVWR